MRSLLFVLAVLVVVEVGVRAVESRLSVDIEHIQEMPRIVSDLLGASEAENEPSLLFLGNSLTRRGVDLETFEERLGEEGVDELRMAAIYPDGTSVLDWLFLYRTNVAGAKGVPDVVVINFGFWHLEDRPVTRAQAYRLGRYYTNWPDLSELFREDVRDLSDRIDVVLSKLSAVFANRERISQRILSFVPYYQQSARQINDMIEDAGDQAEGAVAEKSYLRLVRLIEEIEGSGSELVFMAIPTRDGYSLDPRVAEIAEAQGADFIDARQVPGLTAEQFEDNLHLDPSTGAKLYSEYAAGLLAPVLAGLLSGGD